MRKNIILCKNQIRIFQIIILFGFISLGLFTFFLVDFVKARVIDTDNIVKKLSEQSEKQAFNPRAISKVVVQRGLNYEKGLDVKCISWSTTPVSSGWTKDPEDPDFFIEYYVPPNKKAIICTTPALATALTADADKPFTYEVYPTDYGLRVRIIVGISEVRMPCKSFTGNVNCVNYMLSKQAIVRHEP
ncbi:MAG: hypothetical protein ACHBN1_19865 [Heteroscytonema crispum UTEX LB 1556]